MLIIIVIVRTVYVRLSREQNNRIVEKGNRNIQTTLQIIYTEQVNKLYYIR